jgi:archaellum component FlaC
METEGTPEPMSFVERLHRMPGPGLEQPESHPNLSTGKGVGKRPSVTEIFAPETPSTATDASKNVAPLMIHLPPPDVTNIFDMSQDKELAPITTDNEPMRLLHSAVVMADAGEHAFTSTPYKDSDDQTVYHSMGLLDMTEDNTEISRPNALAPTPPPTARGHERSHSFSFGQTVFHSLGRTSASSSEKSRLSDSSSIFRNQTHESSLPKADINDDPGANVVVYGNATANTPDPFRANATTYYTPQTMIPPTPPPNSAHSRMASKEEDVLWSLRTQLALQQELCAQYEIDLAARDEIVHGLTARCEKTEKEGERRRGVLRSWKKKVSELEKACRGLQEEVERGREESWERSVMDEASGEALKCLQRRIEKLEREKGEGDKIAQKVLEEKERLEEVLGKFKQGLTDAKEENQNDGDVNSVEELKTLLAKKDHASVAERERHRIAEFEWEEERTRLISRGAQLEVNREELAVELAAAQEQLTQKDNDCGDLKSELEAQWKHTESASEQMEEMQREMNALRDEAEGLEKRINEMAVEWNESESRRTELEGEIQEMLDVKEAFGREKREVSSPSLYSG